MAVQKKMANFVPVAGDATFSAEFDCWHPDARFQQEEETPATVYRGENIPHIPAEGGLSFANLPKMLEDMIKYSWTAAAPSAGAARGPVQLGGARQQALAAMRTSFSPAAVFKHADLTQKAAAPYRPMPTGVGVAKDWNLHRPLERVNAYTFRGQMRDPVLVCKDKGFQTPYSRTDPSYMMGPTYTVFKGYMQRLYGMDVSPDTFERAYKQAARTDEDRKVLSHFLTWHKLMGDEQYHLGRMKKDEVMKGYVCTSRAVTVAKGFTLNNGWVYVTRVRGGFVLPGAGHAWTLGAPNVKNDVEQEIAFAGSLPWSEVFGFRQVGLGHDRVRFIGPVYLRKGFEALNSKAFSQVFELMCGKKQ